MKFGKKNWLPSTRTLFYSLGYIFELMIYFSCFYSVKRMICNFSRFRIYRFKKAATNIMCYLTILYGSFMKSNPYPLYSQSPYTIHTVRVKAYIIRWNSVGKIFSSSIIFVQRTFPTMNYSNHREIISKKRNNIE